MPQPKPPPSRTAGYHKPLDHFLFLAKSGRHPGTGSGAQAAAALAAAVREHAPALDAAALAGLAEFIQISKFAPETAGELLRWGE